MRKVPPQEDIEESSLPSLDIVQCKHLAYLSARYAGRYNAGDEQRHNNHASCDREPVLNPFDQARIESQSRLRYGNNPQKQPCSFVHNNKVSSSMMTTKTMIIQPQQPQQRVETRASAYAPILHHLKPQQPNAVWTNHPAAVIPDQVQFMRSCLDNTSWCSEISMESSSSGFPFEQSFNNEELLVQEEPQPEERKGAQPTSSDNHPKLQQCHQEQAMTATLRRRLAFANMDERSQKPLDEEVVAGEMEDGDDDYVAFNTIMRSQRIPTGMNSTYNMGSMVEGGCSSGADHENDEPLLHYQSPSARYRFIDSSQARGRCSGHHHRRSSSSGSRYMKPLADGCAAIGESFNTGQATVEESTEATEALSEHMSDTELTDGNFEAAAILLVRRLNIATTSGHTLV